MGKMCSYGSYIKTASAFILSVLLPISYAGASTGSGDSGPIIADGPGVYLRYSDYPTGSMGFEELDPDDIASSEILHGYDALSEEEKDCVFPPFSLGDTEGIITPEFMSPLIVHSLDCTEPVRKNIKLFSEPMKDRFSLWLRRSGRYVGLMKGIFREKGLPEDLVYLALVESGFNPRAYSRARACGPWQFISATGRKYGLRYDYWVDERRDPVKSTIAAADYLTDLYNMFGTWSLAMASYNAGEGRVSRAVRSVGTLDFWKLREERAIARETREYIPRFLAAKAIAKNPEAYGFTGLEYDQPFEYEIVRIDVPISIDVAAKCCGVSANDIKAINPELRRWCTPPNTPGYELRVPKGSTQTFLAAFEKLPESEKTGWSEYVVRRGDTLGDISRHYNVPVSVIASTNNIRRVSRISIGQRLIIPAPDAKTVSYTATRYDDYPGYQDASGTGWYRVRRGDTLWEIARRHGMSTHSLARLNGISTRSTIRPGQRLKVSGSASTASYASSDSTATYRVRRGDTLGKIARRHGMSLRQLTSLNGISSRSTIWPGQKLLVKGGEPSSSSYASSASTATYRVRSGDTLWEIAQRHGMTLGQLAGLNGLSTRSTIRPGQRLKVYGASSPAASKDYASLPTKGGSSYRVRSGDTIWEIARRHGVSVDAILKANSLSKRSVIKPGQTIMIPSGGEA